MTIVQQNANQKPPLLRGYRSQANLCTLPLFFVALVQHNVLAVRVITESLQKLFLRPSQAPQAQKKNHEQHTKAINTAKDITHLGD